MACRLLLSPSGKISLIHSGTRLAAMLLLCAACDSGSPAAKTADEIAADSALAADLALANRDTLLIDSIGQFRPVEGTVADTSFASVVGSSSSANAPAPAPTTKTIPAVAKPTPAPAPSRTAVVPPAPAPVAAPKPLAPPTAPRRTGGVCGSPALADQQACVHATLAAADMRMNRVYRALITEMRREEKIRPGQKDPPSVDRLRVAQRAWLVYRDTECRRRGRGKEGALWARPRVRCLGEFAIRRANELADNFSRLTAQ